MFSLIDVQAANQIPVLVDVHLRTLWFMYLIGQLVHILSLAYVGSKTNSDNPALGMIAYLKMRWPVVIARTFILTLGFLLWIHDPETASDIARYFGGKLSPGAIHDFLFNVGIPLNVATAGAYGYIGDSALDKVLTYVPWLKDIVPTYIVQTTTKETLETKHTVEISSDVKPIADSTKGDQAK